MEIRGLRCILALAAVVSVGQAAAYAAPGDLLQTFLSPLPSIGEQRFGWSLAMDESSVLVGAFNGNIDVAGAAYLFDRSSGNIVRTFVNPEPLRDEDFGIAVAMTDNKVFIGSGGTLISESMGYLFDRPTGTLIYVSTLGSTDLNPISMAAIGDSFLAGAPAANGSGAAYLVDGVTGSFLRNLQDPDPRQNYAFGCSVAAAGSNVLVGRNCSGDGTVNLFSGSTGDLMRTFRGPLSYNYTFGWSVAAVGNNVAIGAPCDRQDQLGDGIAYLFDGSTGELLQTFMNPEPGPGGTDYFGWSVAGVGDDVLIGAWGKDSMSGKVYLFDGATGQLMRTFSNPDPSRGGNFGRSLAVVGNQVLIGADAAAYLFEVPEPATLSMIALGALVMLRRKKK